MRVVTSPLGKDISDTTNMHFDGILMNFSEETLPTTLLGASEHSNNNKK